MVPRTSRKVGARLEAANITRTLGLRWHVVRLPDGAVLGSATHEEVAQRMASVLQAETCRVVVVDRRARQ